jgi:hypothetical protein
VLSGRIDETNRRIDEVARFLGGRIDDRYELLLRRIDGRFMWTIATMVALSGLIITVLKP